MTDEEKNNGEEKEMSAATKPIESTKINFNSQEDYEKFIDIINNPVKPNDYVKKLFKEYQQSIEDKK